MAEKMDVQRKFSVPDLVFIRLQTTRLRWQAGNV